MQVREESLGTAWGAVRGKEDKGGGRWRVSGQRCAVMIGPFSPVDRKDSLRKVWPWLLSCPIKSASRPVVLLKFQDMI